MDFSNRTKERARLRQWGMCACCGEDLSWLEEHAHHIDPNALGGRDHPDNCVVLCVECHHRVHNDGRFNSLVVAPRSYYP